MKKRLAVIGVGSAGIVSINHFCAWLGNDWEIVSIYDPSVNILSIGESTNAGFIANLERGCGFILNEDKAALDATLKYGTKFINWRNAEWINPLIEGTVAIHFNTFKLKEFVFPKLKDKWGSKFKVLEGTVDYLTQTKNYAVVTINGVEEKFDYVIDCRGFPEDLEKDYIISDCSLVNHCVVYDDPRAELDLIYTEHYATKNGWMFSVPLTTRKSYGYLYNDSMTSKQDALEDMSDIIGAEVTEENTREFKFKPYYAKKFVDGRIFKNGNRAIFFEPISATSIYLYVRFCDVFYDVISGASTEIYANQQIRNETEDVATCIRYYYHGGSTFDTEFWNNAKKLAVEQLQGNYKFYDMLEQYKDLVKQGTLYNHPGFVFPAAPLHALDKLFGYNYFTGENEFKFDMDRVDADRAQRKARLKTEWDEYVSQTEGYTAKEFAEQRYCLVKNVLDKTTIDLVTQYARFDQQANFSPEGEGQQIPGTHSKYADPMMETLLLKMHPVMEQITGLNLHPTYSYYRVYKPGDILEKHTDRPSCEVSCTVCFNFDYKEMNGVYSWPIWMVDTPYTMEPGDIVVYHGCELVHWRDEFKAPEGSWHVQAFLHYVDANGPYADCKYDGRTGVGAPISSRNTELIRSFSSYDYQEPSVQATVVPTTITGPKKYIIYTK